MVLSEMVRFWMVAVPVILNRPLLAPVTFRPLMVWPLPSKIPAYMVLEVPIGVHVSLLPRAMSAVRMAFREVSPLFTRSRKAASSSAVAMETASAPTSARVLTFSVATPSLFAAGTA